MNDPRTATGRWTFEGMGEGFDEHVAAHLPGYMDVQRLIATIATYLAPSGSVIADYGASTGATASIIREALPDRDLTLHLYDADRTMLDKARERVPDANLHCVTFPGCRLSHEDADLSLSLWFLQFLHPKDRLPALQQMHDTTRDGGALIVATKGRHADSRWEEIAVGALDDYKDHHGVAPDERAAKSRALRGTMHPVSPAVLMGDLVRAGWRQPTILWRWHVWTVIGAFRGDL